MVNLVRSSCGGRTVWCQPTGGGWVCRMSVGWRDGRLFAMHWDFHAQPDDTEVGAGLTHDVLRTWITDLQLDWVQCDCKGAWGLTSYPTKVGTPAPGLVGDLLAMHRDVTRELGLPL